MKTQYWFLLLSLGVSACVTAGGVTESHPEPPLENADQWQGMDCQKIKVVPRSEYLRHAQCVAAQLPPLDPNKREYFGEQYSPRKYLECKLKYDDRESSCDIYKLRRAENPEYWPNPDVPKPKWPDAPKESVYKFGMSSKDYFEALCKAEAGEFIYKTVENVEGVYQVRPLTRNEDQNNDLFVIEDPYGIDYPSSEMTARNFLMRNRYRFFETPIQKNMIEKKMPNTVERFFFSSDQKTMQRQYSELPKSRYGFTWRGIQRPHDRELGIAGGELIVLDLETNEILAIRRGFARLDYIPHTMPQKYWGADSCPRKIPLPLFLIKAAKPNTTADIEGDSK